MPAYHSTFLDDTSDARTVGNFAVLPLATKFRGPAYPLPPNSDYDIIDETLDLFRANLFFRNFEIKGAADRTLIYGILFVSECLGRLNANTPEAEAHRALLNLALDSFNIPGDPGFPLNLMYQSPGLRQELDLLRQYIQQFRQELAERLIARVYQDGRASKHWLAFTKRRFMNRSL